MATDIEACVRSLIGDVTKRSGTAPGLDDDLVEHLGIDSLQGLELLAGVEKRLAVRLADEELVHLRTIGRIVQAVERAREEVHS